LTHLQAYTRCTDTPFFRAVVRTFAADGANLFYRDASPADAPVLLLPGVPAAPANGRCRPAGERRRSTGTTLLIETLHQHSQENPA